MSDFLNGYLVGSAGSDTGASSARLAASYAEGRAELAELRVEQSRQVIENFTGWCEMLEHSLHIELGQVVADGVIERTLVNELKQHDPDNWMLVAENRRRIATRIREQSVAMMRGDDRDRIKVFSPSGRLYAQPEGYAYIHNSREIQPDEQAVGAQYAGDGFALVTARRVDADGGGVPTIEEIYTPLLATDSSGYLSPLAAAEAAVRKLEHEIATQDTTEYQAAQSRLDLAQKAFADKNGGTFFGTFFSSDKSRKSLEEQVAIEQRAVDAANERATALRQAMQVSLDKAVAHVDRCRAHLEARKALAAQMQQELNVRRAALDAEFGVGE